MPRQALACDLHCSRGMVVLEPANEPSRSDRTARSAVSVLLIDDDQDASEIIALTKRTAVVRIDVHNGQALVGAAQGTVTITAPR